jgi:hypothetical protein
MTTTKLMSFWAVAFALTLASCSKNDNDDTTKTEYTGIYFMDSYNEDIETLPIAGGTPASLAGSINGAGIAYDKTNEKIYYSVFSDDDDTPNGKIYKMNVDGTSATAIATGINDPYGIALDTKNNKVYWGDDEGNVSRCDFDGSNLETGIVTIDGGGIRAVALDLTNSKLYFYDVNNNNLYEANPDGTSASVIISGYYGYAICVDEENCKIYFDAQTDNASVSALYRANLDGSNPVEIDNTQSRIYGIAVDTGNSKVYWSGRDTYEIYVANLNGTNKVTLATDLGTPRGIFLKY